MATGGGMGARPTKDGLNATQFPSTIRGVPAEIVESTSPLVIHRRALAPDSDGAGKWRGGLGMIVEFGVETDDDWLFTASFERARIPCQGLFGGGPGAPGRVETASGRSLDSKAQHWMRPDDRVVLHTPGGGGYGLGCVYQRGPVWWVAYWWRGAKRRESSRSAKKKDAVALLKRRIQDIGKGRFIDPRAEEKVMMSDFFDGVVTDYMNNKAYIGEQATRTTETKVVAMAEARR